MCVLGSRTLNEYDDDDVVTDSHSLYCRNNNKTKSRSNWRRQVAIQLKFVVTFLFRFAVSLNFLKMGDNKNNAEQILSSLDQIKLFTTVVADTGDFEGWYHFGSMVWWKGC